MRALEILEAMIKNNNLAAYGLRAIDNDKMPAIGEDVEFSHDWDFENDCFSDELLNGSSTIGIVTLSHCPISEDLDSDEKEEMMANIEQSIKLIKQYCYDGNQVVLVAGDFAGYGDDPSEILINGIRIL